MLQGESLNKIKGVQDEIQRQGLRKRTYSEREGTEGNSYLGS
jgi:hypothetical protein